MQPSQVGSCIGCLALTSATEAVCGFLGSGWLQWCIQIWLLQQCRALSCK